MEITSVDLRFLIMRATLDFLKERFVYFNDLCFGGCLPAAGMRISSSVRTFGTLRHPRVFKGDPKPSDFVLSISDRLDQEKNVIEDTIIHEMIHLYIFFFKIKDSSAHGPVFRKIMNDINVRYARNITVSRRASESERTSDRIVRPRILLVTSFSTGERTVTVCAPRYVKGFVGMLRQVPRVSSWQLYVARGSWISHYPVSRTLKFYRIDADILDRGLADARKLEITDGKVKMV